MNNEAAVALALEKGGGDGRATVLGIMDEKYFPPQKKAGT